MSSDHRHYAAIGPILYERLPSRRPVVKDDIRALEETMETLTHEEIGLEVLQFTGNCTKRNKGIAPAFARVTDAASLLVDLSEVENLDGVFLGLLDKCKRRCANLVVLVADTGPGVLFLATELSSIFPVYTDREEAVYRLRLGES
jgi:hypothetical protein